MKKFRDSRFAKFMAWVMLMSITLVSCDPERHVVNEISMQKHAEEISEFYALSGVNLDCSKVKQYLTKAKNYVLNNNGQGHLTSRTELISYLAQEAVTAGDMSANEITPNNLSQVTSFAEYMRFVTNGSSIEPMLNKLVEQSTLTSADGSFILGLQNQLEEESNDSPAETIGVLNDKLNELSSSTTITGSHKDALTTSMNITKALLCDNGSTSAISSGNNSTVSTPDQAVSSRCEIIECMTTYEWTLAIVYVVLTIVLVILAIFTFGLSLFFTTIIAVVVWTLATVVTCWIVDCDDPLCPEGQTPTCQGNFILDEEGRRCINPNLPNNAFIFQGCILSPRLENGTCPPGSTPKGQNCEWECFFPDPEGFGIGDDGQIQFNYTCN